MAPITLIVGKHRRDQTEDKEAIQIFSYNQSGLFSVSYEKDTETRQSAFDSEKQARGSLSKSNAHV